MSNDDYGACPRCGHDNPDDLTRRPNGDHLVREEGSLTFGRLPDTDGLTFRFTASQNVRFVWCSTRPLPAPDAIPRHAAHNTDRDA